MGALKIKPDSAASYHGLGLAFEGMNGNDDSAIQAWLKVHDLDPSYNFEVRIRFSLK
jgi:lipoprotein NlpI